MANAAMKVQDLKRVLKARGLSTAGTKSELVERLQTIGDAPNDIPQDLHGVISSLESPGSRNMMAKEDEVTSENNDITTAPTATLPDVQRNLQSQELPGSFEAATEDGGSLPMTAKVDTEEYVDCADELLTETTSAPIVARDSAFPAPLTLLGDAQGQDGLQCHTPVQFPETNTLTDSGPTAKESLYEHKDRGTDKSQLHPSASTYDLVVEEMTQKANEDNMSSSDRGLVSKGWTEERAGYNYSVCTSLECAQTSQQTRLEELESQMSELTNRLQHADAERKKFDQMAQRLKRLENMWQERLESKEALLSLMARCEGLETRLNRLLNDQLADLHVASQEDTCDDQGVLSTSAHKTQASQTDLLGIRGVEKANEAQEAESNKTSVDDTRPKCASGVNRADGSEDRLGRQSLLCPPGNNRETCRTLMSHEKSTQRFVRPPWGVKREVLIAGDHNVGQFAQTLHGEMTDDQSFEILMNRKATVATVHAMIAEYEGQARRIPRMYILHVGMNDLLQGHQPDAIVECLENKWRTRQGALVVCSIPEVTSRGKEMQAAAMLLNARLKKMCKKIRAKYVDLTRDLAITATMKKDGLHYNKEGTHVVTGRLAEVAETFLGERRKRRSNTGGHWYPKQLDEKSLTQNTEEVVHHQVRRRGLEGSQVHDSRPEAPSPSRETWMGYPPRPRFKSDTRGQVVRPIMKCATMQGSALPEKKSLMGELAPSRERTPAVPASTCLHLRQMPPSTCMDPPWVAMPNPRQMNMGLYPFVPNSSIPGCYPLDPPPWIQAMVAQTVRRQLETTGQE